MNQDAGRPADGAPDDAVPELELADEEILDAMQHIPGYVDISSSCPAPPARWSSWPWRWS